MPKNKQEDKIMKLIKISLLALFAGLFIYLCEFLIREPAVEEIESDIPSLNVSRLNAVSDKINQRQDAQTNGKPNINKFDFGNQEPF
jgi:hypothetical protein